MGSDARWAHEALLHAWWVEPGRLLAGEYPGARTAEKTARKLQLLIDAGVNTIVDLTRPEDHLEPYREALRTACESAGLEIRYFAHPIPDMDVIDQAGYDRILACIRGEIDSGRVVYLHCWGGKGRTSTVVGCLFIDGGLDYDAAIARIAELRAGTRKSAEACPEAPSQHRVLRERAAMRHKSQRR
jgi:protein-tyrosine phosphatase